MTEQEAKEAILSNGYKLLTEGHNHVDVADGRGSFRGVNWLDLAQHFKLHEKKARK